MTDPAIDPACIEQLLAINPEDGGEFLRELVEIFLSDTPRRLEEMTGALLTGDGPLLSRTAHSIKGGCGNFGATPLMVLAEAIEGHGKAARFDQVRTLLPDFEAEFARVRLALEKVAAGT